MLRWFDRNEALLEVEAGITWPDVIRGYLALQRGPGPAFGIRQKQTGADRLTLGGAVAANIHGRGADRAALRGGHRGAGSGHRHGRRACAAAATKTPTLFRHVVGGYGLFGVVTAVTLRLVPRVKVERCVARLDIDELIDAFDERIADGHLYGDFQFATAPQCADFLRTGVLSSYRPVDPAAAFPTTSGGCRKATGTNCCGWRTATSAPPSSKFTEFYLATHGQLYWSDTHQLNLYLEDYHGALDHRLGAAVRGSEMITELYVPRDRLVAFMNDVRRDFRMHGVDFIYGTIRLIEAEHDTALPWAREDWACVIFNLHIDHRPRGPGARGGAFPPAHRSRAAPRRQLLPHLSPLRERSADARRPSRHARFPRRQARARSGRGVPERLVPAVRELFA